MYRISFAVQSVKEDKTMCETDGGTGAKETKIAPPTRLTISYK